MPPAISTSHDRVRTPLRVDLPRLGTIQPRSASEVGLSNWTLGCEVLDRDFADWDQYKDYIAPLGLKSIRLQAGWAKCERVRGVYDFAWLDHIVDDAIARGLNPILETDYGNPVYPGGGGWDLGAGFPTSPEALAAWDAWVGALTSHFAGRVRDWFMWNEPDISPQDGSASKTPDQIAAFNVRTARIVKKAIPDARIAGLSLARNRPEYLEECLRALGDDVSLFDWFIYHGYQEAPETSYENVEAQKAVVARLAPHARLRQGENGCPSEMANVFALKLKAWSEYSQAKWDLRRMLGDFGHGVESSIFTICDFNHLGREINRKGLLRADEDHRVIGVKRAYYAVQNLASVFGGASLPGEPQRLTAPDLSLSTYELRSYNGGTILAFWTHGRDFVEPELAGNAPGLHAPKPDNRIMPYLRPGDSFETRPAVLEHLGGEPLRDPVWVDLLTGRVHAFPRTNVVPCRDRVRYLDVPVYDSPCLLAERDALPWEPLKDATAAGNALVVDAAMPAGNIVFCGAEGDSIRLRKDLRDTKGHWIYWAFRVRGAAGRTLAFEFLDPLGSDAHDHGAVGTRGAAVSTDRGASWAWTDDFRDDPRDPVTGDHDSFFRFTWRFAPDADEVWFSQTIPYGQREWEAFLARHEADRGRLFETGTLCRSRKGRAVETARFGRLDGQAPYKMLITSRHHCGEATATFVLEGILETALADDDLGQWLRDNVEIRTVPFMDKDGVVDGDQGKNRQPHDHNRDYNETPIYPEVRAICAMAAEWTADGTSPIVLDLHSPWLRGSWFQKDNANEYAYVVGKREKEAPRRRFCAILERIQRGGMGFQASDYYDFGRGWNTGINYAAGRSSSLWAMTQWPDSPLTLSFEIPFANARHTTLRPPIFRAFGRDIVAAIREFLLHPDSPCQ